MDDLKLLNILANEIDEHNIKEIIHHLAVKCSNRSIWAEDEKAKQWWGDLAYGLDKIERKTLNSWCMV